MMRMIRSITIVTILAAFSSLLSTSGCASTNDQESLGEVVDDSLITAKVKSAFVEDKVVDAADISVETFKGTVQLSGFAKSQAQIDRAVEVARKMKGVRGVRNSVQLRANVTR